MPIAPEQPARRPRAAGVARGFTFIEVMFAVLILGFGVIMIAAMLPVAIRQSTDARETAQGSATVERGFQQLNALWASTVPDASGDVPSKLPLSAAGLPQTSLPPTPGGQVQTYPEIDMPGPAEYPAVNGSPATTADPSLPGQPPVLFQGDLGSRTSSGGDASTAYVPFYARSGSLRPQLAVLAIAARNLEGDRIPPGFFLNPDNCPLPVEATFKENSIMVGERIEDIGLDTVELAVRSGSGVTAVQIEQAMVEGAALVAVNGQGELRVYRLGDPVPGEATTFNLAVGTGGLKTRLGLVSGSLERLTETTETLADGPADDEWTVDRAYLVGRMLADPTQRWRPPGTNENPYVGPSQVTQTLENVSLP